MPDVWDAGGSQLRDPIYVAGPMSGVPDFNFPAFRVATRMLRAKGHTVISPAELDEKEGDVGEHPWGHYLRRDIRRLVDCNTVAVLDGWRESRGAKLEVHIARELGMEVVSAETLEPVTETVLEEADRLVSGARQRDYGHPLDDFRRTGRIWGAVLGIEDVTPEQVALCMVGVKISREVNRPNRDNRVDGPGYWKCLDLIHQERRKRGESAPEPGGDHGRERQGVSVAEGS